MFITLDSGVGTLDKNGLDIDPCAGDARGFLLAGTIVIAGSKTSPGTKIS